MSSDGLWTLESSDQHPVTLDLASWHLSQYLASVDEPPACAAKQPGGWKLLRFELPVLALAPTTTFILDWLEVQSGSLPRSLYAARDGSLLLAGAGAAHIYTKGATELKQQCQSDEISSELGLLPELGLVTHERIRYIGGARFDTSDPETFRVGLEWEPFGQYFWVLPRVELSVGEMRAHKVMEKSTRSTDTESSCTSTLRMTAGDSSDGCSVTALFAVHLRWHVTAESATWPRERAQALKALKRLRPCGHNPCSLPATVASRSDAVLEEAFKASVQEALRAFEKGSLQKVVLARRVLLQLARKADAVSLLRQVVGNVYKRHYLLLIEPLQGTAFLSLTPERLCRVHGRDIWTEAVAGTWPIAEFEKICEAALLASSAKHSSEHQLVVDYICNLLGEVSQHIKVCDTHLLKLKHLVHIKQSYHAIAKDGQSTATGDTTSTCSTSADSVAGACHPPETPASVPFDVTTFFCKRMSPTPAVCGLPLDSARRFIRRTEPFDRGFYAAPCGILSANGSELIVALRSALLRDGQQLHVYAGAGIVPGSNPAEEFAEISLKMRQYTEGIPAALPGTETPVARIRALKALPNLNTLWSALVIEEFVRLGMRHFVICPGSRSTPLVVAVAQHPHASYIVNHDERGAAFYALGWAKALGVPVGVIVTSGTAVANLLPGAVEAAQSQVPLVLLTADRPAELRDTGANQTIRQPGIFGDSARWAKDFPCPSVEYPAHALLSDIDLAVAHATGGLSQHPGPVHLNFCFRENLAPDAGPVRGAPERSSKWDDRYLDTIPLQRWTAGTSPHSTYVATTPIPSRCDVIEELIHLASSPNSRLVVLVGTLRSAAEVMLAEDIASRLRAATFADITSGLRQRPSTVHYADQLLNSPLLAGDVLQIDAVVRLGGPVCSARLSAFVKMAAPKLHVRVASIPMRFDPDHTVTHHVVCSLQAFAESLAEAGLKPVDGPPAFWKKLSHAAGDVLEKFLTAGCGLTEPFVACTVSQFMPAGHRLQISSSMPIRDLDFFSKPRYDPSSAPMHPPMANRGASGIDGVLSTAVGFCRGAGAPSTLIIGDVASLHDLNALQQLSGPSAPALTVVIVNNGGAGIFSFLPISCHQSLMSPCFTEPHATDFSAACQTFGIPYIMCETAEAFESAYIQSQKRGLTGACVIEARAARSHEDNVALHKEIGQAVAARVRAELLAHVRLGWLHTPGSGNGDILPASIMLLHGWLGEKADWAEVSHQLAEAGQDSLAVDLPGHGTTEVGSCEMMDPWEAAAFFSLKITTDALAELLDRLMIERVAIAGYSLGGRVAMAFAAKHPTRVVGLIALSANPGLELEVEREQRRCEDRALALRLSDMVRTKGWEAFLKNWYVAPLWGGLSERRKDVYQRMLAKRRQTSPQHAVHSLLGMSLALQPDLCPGRSGNGTGSPLWYTFGALDGKYARLGQELKDLGLPASRVVQLPDAGHALVEECPCEIANLCSDVVQWLRTESVPSPIVVQATELQMVAAWSEPVELLLNAPLLLSRGDPMPQRSGVLVIIQGRKDDDLHAGLGEISPLPLFHQESLAEAQTQLQVVLRAWTSSPPLVPLVVARLDGAMQTWLKHHCPGGDRLLPSVRCGLEMALLHLLGRAASAPHLGAESAKARRASCCSEIGINALVAREEDLNEPSHGPTVVKVKVGKDPAEDALRTNSLAELLKRQRGPQARLRLDANQAWTLDESVIFVNGLSDCAVSCTEYLEEPVRWTGDPSTFLRHWELLSIRTQRRVALAVDESLTEGRVRLEHIRACEARIAALILKPALQGLEQTLDQVTWALANDVQPVLSSAFESGVALCHFAILAGTMSPPPWMPDAGVSACHGLGTFTRLAEDVLRPPFADLVYVRNGCGWRVNLLRCQEALDRTVDALVSARCPKRS